MKIAPWRFPRLDSVVQDARYGIRQMRRAPLFTLATAGTLALTIGATGALFVISKAVILRPLPYPASDRLVSISNAAKDSDSGVIDEPTASLAMTSVVPSFEAVAAYNRADAAVMAVNGPEHVTGLRISGRFFDVMGVQPALGRAFVAEELQRGGPAAVVVSDGLWSRVFGRSADVLSREVSLDDHSYHVVGVMPPGFRFPGTADFWLPQQPRTAARGAMFFVRLIGRLSPRATPAAAREDLLALRRSRHTDVPTGLRESDVRVVTVHERFYGSFRLPILLLCGAVACVLFIGCANVATLLLARGQARRQELAIRTSLGAGANRLVRQMLVESVLLSVLGAVPAIALMAYALRAFAAFGPVPLRRLPGIAVDAPAVLFLLGVTLAVGLLFGIAPALAARRARPYETLKRAGVAGLGGHTGAGRILVTLEITAAVVVTIGAALLAKSLLHYQSVDRGFNARNVLSASVMLPSTRYPSDAARRAFFDAVTRRLRSLPNVESAAAPAALGVLSMTAVQWADGADAPGGDPASVGVAEVGAGYFRTFEIPIRRGRECDDAGAPSAVVNERMARRFGGRSPLGETVKLNDSETLTIVGVAADVRGVQSNVPPMPMVFTCLSARNAPTLAYFGVRPRLGVDAASLAPALRAAVAAVDPAQPIAEVTTLRQELDDAVAPWRFNTLLFGGFAVLAFTLSVFGLYAVTASLVAGRSREFGIRIALGAGRARVLQLVLRQGLAPAASGLALGLIASFMLTRLLRAMLFDVEVLDAGAFAAVPLVLAFVSLAAAIVPARRAVRVDPVVALRCD